MVKCPKCGAEVKYIVTRNNTVAVDIEYIEVITDSGRTVKGHIKHECKGKQDNGQ